VAYDLFNQTPVKVRTRLTKQKNIRVTRVIMNEEVIVMCWKWFCSC